VLVVLGLHGLAGCGPRNGAGGRVATTTRHDILAWLECTECSDGELARVVALGTAPGSDSSTVDSLDGDLRGGPSAARRANMRQQLDSAYEEDSLQSAAEGLPPVIGRGEYVDRLLDNYVNTYRVRAARALAEIGGPAAKAALDSAFVGDPTGGVDTLRADARLAVLFVRDSMLGP
jgi:hypothetical protein